MQTTVRLSRGVKEKLDAFKVHSRESYNDVISRMIDDSSTDVDAEILAETIEVLSDPDALTEIAEALRDFEEGKFVELK